MIVKNDNFENADLLFVEEEFASKEAFKICNDLYAQGKCKEIIFVRIEENDKIYSDEQEEFFIKNVVDSLYKNLPITFLNLKVEHPITLNKSKEVLNIIDQKGAKSIVVLTNAFHSRRTRNVYRKILESSDIKLNMLTYYLYFNKDNWWQTSVGFRTVIPEYLKYGYYLIRGYM